MNAIVGYTGFVGQNLCMKGRFDALYNSKNIADAYGTAPARLYFCGIGAQKFLANTNPEADLAVIENAIENIKLIKPKSVVLISTIDVYKTPDGADEDTLTDMENLHAYGKNRLLLEKFVDENFDDSLIVRLPGLYGKGLKKNFVYDMINPAPSMLRAEKLEELGKEYLSRFYTCAGDGFYRLNENAECGELLRYLSKSGFTALCFTDSRSVFQLYNLDFLYGHIDTALKNRVKLVNMAVEPISAAELYAHIFQREFKNELRSPCARYDFRTKHSSLFCGAHGYIFDRQFVLDDVRRFVLENIKQQRR
ncbi:MAG: NAD(P)-dependent oxidoreductase [Oscillospiraceae bacterium]